MSDSNYLSPGVYIQELEGPAPIVGVSTSIAAFIGMAERGPVNVPILCSSPGDYTRWFGGLLVPDEFADPNDSNRFHCYLPYAVAGFFNNSGQVAYVIRVLPDEASAAWEFLYDRTGITAVTSALVRSAAVGDGSATTPLIMLSPVPPASTAALISTIRIGDGSVSEYQQIAATASVTDLVALDLPLALSHAAGTPTAPYARVAQGTSTYTLTADVVQGQAVISVSSANSLNTFPDLLLELAGGGVVAIVVPAAVVPTVSGEFSITLTQPLTVGFAAATTVVTALVASPAAAGSQMVGSNPPYTLTANAAVGATSLTVNSSTDNLATFSNWLLELVSGAVTAVVTPTAVTSLGGGNYTVTIASPLTNSFPATSTQLTPVTPQNTLDLPASGGDALLFVAGGSGLTSGDAPAYYTVNFRQHGTTTWTTATTTATSTSYTVTGLTAGDSYDFEVIATNGAGDSPPSLLPSISTTAAAATVPGQVTGVTAGATTTDSVALSWTAPASGGAAAAYTVNVRTTAGPGPWIAASTTATGTAYTVIGLTAATSYDFEIIATNWMGSGTASAVVTIVTASPAAGTPGAVIGLSTGATTFSSIALVWTAPSSGGAVTAYTVNYRVSGSMFWVAASTTVTGTSYTVTNLAPSTSYDFAVVATNASGPGATSAAVTVATPAAPAAAPGAITGLAAGSVTSSGVPLSWTAPTTGGAAADYTVNYRVTGTAAWTTASTAVATTSYTVTGLQPSTSYDFQVIPTNGTGSGPASGTITVSTGAAFTVPDQPIALTAGTITSTTVALSWSAPTGELIDIDPTNPTTREVRTVGALCQLSLAQPASEDWPAKSVITPVAPTAATATSLTAAAAAGTQLLSLASRTNIQEGTVLLLGTAPAQEYASVIAVQGVRALAGPDPGAVLLSTGLVNSYVNNAAVIPSSVNATPPAGRRATQLVLDTPAGGTSALVTWADGWIPGDIVQITLSDGTVAYNTIAAPPAAQGLEAVQLVNPVLRNHAAGSPVVSRNPLIQVQALDAGAWGQRVALAVQDESPGLVSRVQVVSLVGLTQLQLSALTGIQPGSYLELLYPNGTLVDSTTPLKVAAVNLATTTITLDSAVSAIQAGAIGTSTPTTRIGVRSREFRLTVYLYRHPDPAVPSRNTQVIQTETFRNLAMDPRHSQYFQTVIGAINGPLRLSDHRPEGTSWLIRVQDTATTQAVLWSPRLGPEPLVDVLPNGLTKPAQHKLDIGGDDSLATVDDDMYIGADATDPVDRTGIYAVQNAPQVSILAIPGQGTPAIQSAMIDFCETSLYIFAVLDPMYPDSAIADIQAQRQGFDTKYAAFYYPWLTIPDPMPANLALVPDFPLPPSGHVVGIYARVDDSRGVFKAPANEVVQGITGLTSTLAQGDQDVLNPAPNNINVIRDFRPQGRGIRVWGARVITSDDNYRYVPVRRLLIFIEQSLNVGLQDVVFEPISLQLMATVERLIGNFLTTVWASGALQGATPDQGFFVRCDQTTMTADDIDAGRLIALVGVAPVMPAEFVIIQIALMTAATSQ